MVASLLRRLSIDVNLDAGSQSRITQRTNQWIGVAGSARLTLTYRVAVSPRYEWFRDRDGFTTGTPQTVHEFTFTIERPLHKGIVSRIEYRRDTSTRAVFDVSSQSATAHQQSTLLIGLGGYFGSLGR